MSEEPREWLIRKDGYFYRPNCQGYTTGKFEAGRYTKAKAEKEAAVEPWHMKAIHQDEWPDDPPSISVKSLTARITELEAALREARSELVTWIYRESVEPPSEHEAIQKIDAALVGHAPAEGEKQPRREINGMVEMLKRLASGDTIHYSQDGDMAWFAKGDRAFVADTPIIEARQLGYLERKCDDDENYRGTAEYDTISDKGRAAIAIPATEPTP